jgi:hypothetical protein
MPMKYANLPDLSSFRRRGGGPKPSKFANPKSPGGTEPPPRPHAGGVPFVIALTCTLVFARMGISAFLNQHHIGQPDQIQPTQTSQPLTRVRVWVAPRQIDGVRRMPTWGELCEQYRMGDSVRTASLQWYNANRVLAEPEATRDSLIPTGASVDIVFD